MLKISLPFLLLFFICGCDTHQSVNPEVKIEDLAKARQLYYDKSYSESALLFSDIGKKAQGTKKSEALLGEILSFCAMNTLEEVKTKIKDWQIDNVYHWDGKVLNPFATISNGYSKVLTKEYSGNFKHFHILDALIQQGNELALKNFLDIFEEAEALEKFITAKAWYALYNNYYAEAKKLFLVLPKTSKDTKIGLSLIKILEGSMTIEGIELPSLVNGSYFIDVKQVEFGKNKKNLLISNDLLEKPTTEILLVDMLFHLGTIAKHAPNIWMHGLQFIKANKNKFSQPLFKDYLQLFSIAIAWQDFSKGDIAKAKKSFLKIIEEKENLPRFYEASLGIAIIFWIEEEDVEELLQYQNEWLLDDFYWLGGKKIPVFSEERRSQKDWQEYKGTVQRFYLNILDTLCWLGEGRSAYLLYGELINSFSDTKLVALYEKEEKNIPKDVYAENKIWEKID